jgi:hypothetical protein
MSNKLGPNNFEKKIEKMRFPSNESKSLHLIQLNLWDIVTY